MKNEYFRLCFNITPSYCKPITYTAVINESFETFIKRNTDKYQSIEVAIIQACNEDEYDMYKCFNPTNESYVKMLPKDYKK